jgi:DNA ligase-1
MKRFAQLLEGLGFTNSRAEKLRLLETYFRESPDPDRGFGLAAIAGTLDIPNVTPSLIRKLAESRVDPVLFRLSYDYVGDLAETTSLIWPQSGVGEDLALSDVVAQLRGTDRKTIGVVLGGLLDSLEQSERFALLKLATGGLRVGVSARLVKLALAGFGDQAVDDIEELWFGLEPPYEPLFAWLEKRAAMPHVDRSVLFRPAMLAHPLEGEDIARLNTDDFAAEWKWDGIRVQAVSLGGERRLFSRTGENIGHAFPDIIEAMTWEGVVDGELLVFRDGQVQPFDQLQKRLGRKAVPAKLLTDSPAHLRAYDLLEVPGEDLRPRPFIERRRRLEQWTDNANPCRLDLSEVFPAGGWQRLDRLRADCRVAGYEGLILKRLDSPYLAGRVKGHWFKWKREPLSADCVLMYAQRGHGKRSSYYSDYTFGCWEHGEDGPRLVPVGKAYSGFTDSELLQLDKFVRNKTLERFGPVRAVASELVLEVAFDAVQVSSRHKSGIAMRFPRIKRIRWDKPAVEADWVANLKRLIETTGHVETSQSCWR